MKAVILAGGMGKRLKPITNIKPKPMIKISGVSILLWQINWLSTYGINEIVLCVGYLKEVIKDFVGDGSRFGVKVEYSVEEIPLGTGGALKNARNFLNKDQKFIMLNGDIMANFDLQHLTKELDEGSRAVIAVVPLPSPYGIIEIGEKNKIVRFREKPTLDEYWINAGVYGFNSSIINDLPDNGNIETSLFPTLAKTGAIKAVRFKNTLWRSIDSHKDVEESALEFKSELDEIARKYGITNRQNDVE